MTCREKLAIEHPEKDMKPEELTLTCLDNFKLDCPHLFEVQKFDPESFCPFDYGYLLAEDQPIYCPKNRFSIPSFPLIGFRTPGNPCMNCWNETSKKRYTMGKKVTLETSMDDTPKDKITELVELSLSKGKIVSLYFHKDGDISMNILDKDEN